MNPRIIPIISLIFFMWISLPVSAQIGNITFDLEKDKPEKFKTKVLKSERTGEKKFTLPRRFLENTTSHYNYYFNAEKKIQSVIERARMSHKDNFARLIPYYGFDLKQTAAQASDLDSVIAKSTAGILLHDLRSDWVDNFYLLIGQAYYFRKEFDSAGMTFQFINYNLFPRKKKSGNDPQIVGSAGYESSQSLNVSSREDRKMMAKILSRPPSRNDALVWQIRTLIEMEDFGEAAGLINTLKQDTDFPDRLAPHLQEMEGYWFFKQEMYDSAIVHIAGALPNAIDNEDRARREFLLAQLYELTGDQPNASDYYDKAIRRTTNPLMDIYGNLNKAKMLKSDEPSEIINSVNRLLKMARKDKYDAYRDIIYFSAAELALEIPDTSAAFGFYKQSIRYNADNPTYKNRAFLTMAEMSYEQQDYKNAYQFYDSLQLPDSVLGDMDAITAKKTALAQVVLHIKNIERQDSLQALAALTPADRDAFLKKLSRNLRKQRGIKEEGDFVNTSVDHFDTRNQSRDIFSGNSGKGDWYFYNNSLKSKGFNEFKKVWGKRENTDNWRRSVEKVVNASGRSGTPEQPAQLITGDIDPLSPDNVQSGPGNLTDDGESIDHPEDISVSGLSSNIPLTPEELEASNKKVASSLFQLGKNYQSLLEDYRAAIQTYEESLRRFPDSLYNGEIYMNLFYCYNKLGNSMQATQYKKLLLESYAGSEFASYVENPEKFAPAKKDEVGTQRYQDIYNLFIEGNFEKAIAEKKSADSMYGANYWDPQLLYIESVYYIQQREDSMALTVLNQVLTQYPGTEMAAKANNMVNVLNRRESIENYLTNLQIERIKEEPEMRVFDDTKIEKKVPVTEKVVSEIIPAKKLVTAQSLELDPAKKLPAPVVKSGYTFDPNSDQNVLMILSKVDPVYSIEARNAFVRYTGQKHYSRNLKVTRETLDTGQTALIFSSFISAEEALQFLDVIRKDATAEVSWLPADKYRFIIISDLNLEILKEHKNLQDYIDLLNSRYPGKF